MEIIRTNKEKDCNFYQACAEHSGICIIGPFGVEICTISFAVVDGGVVSLAMVLNSSYLYYQHRKSPIRGRRDYLICLYCDNQFDNIVRKIPLIAQLNK